MSTSKHVTVWCDYQGEDLPPDTYPGCDSHIEIGSASTNAEARREARGAGWKRIGKLDACPVCARHIGRSRT